MRQIQTFTSTYTADVSGVPSALYELGGMIIMHDASGCNSTYNTHDEPRWYDSKSMVYITGLSEIEAIMGDDRKLIDDIVKAAKDLKPRFIAIAGTPIPMITGCDIEANARVIEKETGIPTFGINTNGMHSYVEGAGEALLSYGKAFTKKMPKTKNSINILGATPIDFSINGQMESIEEYFKNNGINVISNYALNADIDKMSKAASASINIVVSSVGIKLAEYFLKTYGTPYIVATLYGEKLKKEIVDIVKKGNKDNITYLTDISKNFKDNKIFIIGESIISKSLAKAIYYKFGFTPRVISGVELGNTYHGDIVKDLSIRDTAALEKQDYFIEDEDEIANIIKDAKIIIADPLYKPIVNKKTIFVENPHEGFSGRLYRKDIMNIVKNF